MRIVRLASLLVAAVVLTTACEELFNRASCAFTMLATPNRTAAAMLAGVADTVTVEVEVANVGSRAGDEVVQLYVRDQVSSVTRPVLELKGFERVTLAAGERRTVRFELGPDAFALWNSAMREVVEPGLFDIKVGPNSADLKTAVLEIV